MKKIKLLSLILALVMLTAAFASCQNSSDRLKKSKGKATFADLLNVNYVEESTDIASVTEITELNGYERVSGNDYFQLFAKIDVSDLTNPKTTYKVFSFTAGKVVGTFEENAETISYGIKFIGTDDFYSAVPCFIVTVKEKTSGSDNQTVTYQLFDTMGNKQFQSHTVFDSPVTVGSCWATCAGKLYGLDEKTYAMTLVGDLPFSLQSDLEVFDRNEKYTYVTGEYSNVLVYDKNLKMVASLEEPANAENWKVFPLQNGNLLTQYVKLLPEDEEKYDFYEIDDDTNVTLKYDLVTEIFSVEDNKLKEINFEYVIKYCFASNSYSAVNSNRFNDGFENFAFLIPVVDHQISDRDADKRFVFLNNDGTLGASLNLVDKQISLPSLVNGTTFKVETTYGTVLTDAEGKVLNTIISDDYLAVGDFFITSSAIYDLSFNPVYNFHGENVAAYRVLKDTVFITEYAAPDNLRDYSIKVLKDDGSLSEICKHVATDPDRTEFSLFRSNGDYGLYVIKKANSAEYTVYNTDGVALITLNNSITDVWGSFERFISASVNDDGNQVYYFFNSSVNSAE